MRRLQAMRALGWVAALALAAPLTTGCSSKKTGVPGSGDGDNNGDGDGNNGDGDGDGDGDHMKPPTPPVDCQGSAEDADADSLDFANNLLASPAPPGGLTPENAPQIVVFGFDDVESVAGVTFVNNLVSGNNPDGNKASLNLNPNGCYIRGWQGGGYGCGMGDLALNKPMVTQNGFAIANHTIDHLENSEVDPGWDGIPDEWRDPDNHGWKFTDDGYGPGIAMDVSTWKDVLMANDTELKTLLSIDSILGFRAPRLEINDNGLKALAEIKYSYDMTLEELLPDAYVTAASATDVEGKKGFNWVPWPYTLDNGSPGIWIQQQGGDKKYVVDYPTGLWEVPVYQVYLDDATGKTVAANMLEADKDCTFPDDVPEDQRSHCFLSDNEVDPSGVKEVSAFDFNMFIYSRFTKEQWLAAMKHTFLMRFYGNRAPLTYGGHPIQYTDPYDSFTLTQQANNYGYRNVLKYNTYMDRAAATKEFVEWIQGDEDLSKATYFMSAQQLVEYMKKPFDKDGKPVDADAVASDDSNGVFKRLGWKGDNADISVEDGNTATITFKVSNVDADASRVSAGLNEGALKGVSHIDIKYNSEVPFRIRFLTTDGTVSTTALLAAVGNDRVARIRVKDFFPGLEASSSEVSSMSLIDASYMEKVNGLAIESAATAVTGTGTFKTEIQQITLHGVKTADLCN